MKVLLVDDAIFVRMSLKKILTDAGFGFTFAEASDGTEAIRKYQIESPDIVIMDITMPELDGIGAVRRIKELNPNAKIIMCSSMGQQEKVVDAVTAGAVDFIVKPYEAAKVVNSVKKVLGL